MPTPRFRLHAAALTYDFLADLLAGGVACDGATSVHVPEADRPRLVEAAAAHYTDNAHGPACGYRLPAGECTCGRAALAAALAAAGRPV